MKIRTTEQLVDKVAAEISWRRKELTDLRYVVQSSAINRTRREAMTRAAVALLYAHWEGFVKAVAEAYLEFVAMQRCKHSELARNMLAVVLRSKLNVAQHSKKIDAHIEVVDFFRKQMDERCVLPYKNAVRSEANLSSNVLIEILRTLGFDAAGYQAKYHLIDNKLLAKRNHIAHGSALDVSVGDYLELQDEVLSLMNLFRNQIENSAVTGHYLQPVEVSVVLVDTHPEPSEAS
jgi:MAE_28990/MAE_18760-like HEPN